MAEPRSARPGGRRCRFFSPAPALASLLAVAAAAVTPTRANALGASQLRAAEKALIGGATGEVRWWGRWLAQAGAPGHARHGDLAHGEPFTAELLTALRANQSTALRAQAKAVAALRRANIKGPPMSDLHDCGPRGSCAVFAARADFDAVPWVGATLLIAAGCETDFDGRLGRFDDAERRAAAGVTAPVKASWSDATGGEVVALFAAIAARHNTPLYQQLALLAPCPRARHRARELAEMVGSQLAVDAAGGASQRVQAALSLARRCGLELDLGDRPPGGGAPGASSSGNAQPAAGSPAGQSAIQQALGEAALRAAVKDAMETARAAAAGGGSDPAEPTA